MSRRRKEAGAFSLFAFQDIIISVTGIMILVTLVLSLQLIQKVENSPSSRTEKIVDQMQSTVALVEQTQARIIDMQSQLSSGAERIDEVAAVNLRGIEDDATNLKDVNDVLAEDLDELFHELAAVNEQRAVVEETAEARKDDAKRIEEIMEDLRKKKQELASLKQSNRVIFNPSAGDAKTPWLVEITKDSMTVAQAGINAPPTTFTSLAELKKWATKRDRNSEYFVLLVKPGGTDSFHRVRGILKQLRFDIGFDLLSKDQTAIDPAQGAANNES